VLPQSIENLTNLKDLYITNNKIKTIPESIGKLINLNWVDLTGNQISSVPSFIGNLPKLEGIRLEQNPIRDVAVGAALVPLNAQVKGLEDHPIFEEFRRLFAEEPALANEVRLRQGNKIQEMIGNILPQPIAEEVEPEILSPDTSMNVESLAAYRERAEQLK
jgi:Leucine-rich repeat (LRR) protein